MLLLAEASSGFYLIFELYENVGFYRTVSILEIFNFAREVCGWVEVLRVNEKLSTVQF